MAQQIVRKAVPAVIQKQVVKAGVKPVVKQAEGFQVMDISSIEFLSSGRGGGKPMDPAVQKLIDKAMTLEIGQGINRSLVSLHYLDMSIQNQHLHIALK